MKKIFTTLFIFAILYQPLSAQDYVNEIINRVNIDSLTKIVKVLSGEETFTYIGTDTLIYSRIFYHGDNKLTEHYIYNKLSEYDLEVNVQTSDILRDVNNVLAVQRGNEYPEKSYMICGHYDAITYEQERDRVPGADDNASGTAAVMEAARILSQYETKYTIIYALWDCEEIGLYGSRYYASIADTLGEAIEGVINLDMIAFDGNKDLKVVLSSSEIENSDELVEKADNINTMYEIGNDAVINKSGRLNSDHASFWAFGYGAMQMGEDPEDFNTEYHKKTDLIDYFNMEYYHNNSRIGIGTLASLAEVIEPVSVTEEKLSNGEILVSPNPFSSIITFSYHLQSYENVELSLYNSLGDKVVNIHKGYQPAGKHSITYTSHALQPGVYFYHLVAGGQLYKGKVICVR